MTARVRIIGDHPHRGASGTVRDDLPMVQGMWRVDLDDSWTGGCFAAPENVRALPPEEDPRG
jgi:hypothetical protein